MVKLYVNVDEDLGQRYEQYLITNFKRTHGFKERVLHDALIEYLDKHESDLVNKATSQDRGTAVSPEALPPNGKKSQLPETPKTTDSMVYGMPLDGQSPAQEPAHEPQDSATAEALVTQAQEPPKAGLKKSEFVNDKGYQERIKALWKDKTLWKDGKPIMEQIAELLGNNNISGNWVSASIQKMKEKEEWIE
ncbi:MAG: hypothetical protein ABR985_02585 [Methanotrichaceae archaeon]|jgi:hypothetical protein